MSDRSFLQTPGRSIGRSASLQRALGTHSVSSSQPSVLSPGASAPRIPTTVPLGRYLRNVFDMVSSSRNNLWLVKSHLSVCSFCPKILRVSERAGNDVKSHLCGTYTTLFFIYCANN